MIDLFDLYNRFTSLVNTFQGGFFRPQTDYERAVNDINMDIWKDYTSMAEKTQEITDYLAPFTKTKNVIVKKQNTYYGIASYPLDYARFSSGRILVHGEEFLKCPDIEADENEKIEAREEYLDGIKEYPIEKVDDSRWAACLQHLTKMPTVEDPKMVQYDGGFKVAPRQISVVVLTYYFEPSYVKFAYSLSPGNVQTGAGDLIIYNEIGSGKLLWNATLINEFLWRLGEKYGYFTRDQFLTQMMNKEKVA